MLREFDYSNANFKLKICLNIQQLRENKSQCKASGLACSAVGSMNSSSFDIRKTKKFQTIYMASTIT